MQTLVFRRIAILIAISIALVAVANAKSLRPFTVADSIGVTQLMDPPIALARYREIDFNFSPDHQLVAVVTRKGCLESGMNEYSLRLYREGDILKTLNTPRTSAEAPYSVAVSFSTSSYKHAIERVTWAPDGGYLAFIGRDRSAIGQVYSYNVRSQQLQQLTSHPTDIASYDFSWSRQLLAFSAYQVKDWTERNRRGYTVRSGFSFELGTKDPSEVVRVLAHYVENIRTGSTYPITLPLAAVPRRFTISPSGRWAIGLGQVREIPAHWRQYEFFRKSGVLGERPLEAVVSGLAQSLPEESDYDDAFGNLAPWIGQYYLVELETGYAKVLLDAPAILLSTMAEPIWSEDEASLILPNIYLPLQGDFDEKERELRRSTRAIVEIDPSTGNSQRITDQPERTQDGKHEIFLSNIKRLVDGSVVVRARPFRSDGYTLTRYARKSGQWAETDQWVEAQHPVTAPVTALSEDERRLRLSVSQDMNTAPEIFAADEVTGRHHSITDLNPQLREMTLGTVELFEWTDRLGRAFRGGLLLPPHYDRGRRYPVVIQTYGFQREEFLLDGPNSITTAYAARALANKGLLVLQMPGLEWAKSKSSRFEESSENPLFLTGLEGAVEALNKRGFIDQAKIGLIGWSREGMHVHYAVTFSRLPFAAAVISDSVTATPLSYILAYGYPRPGMLEWESDPAIIGAPLWGKGVDLWVQRSPLFHLDKISAPLRLEATGIGVPSLWETFAILKRHQRPVELVHIPGDSHNLQTPWGRYTSQQGTVDWFAFWLNGEVDNDPRKAAQYKYWRILRLQHEASKSAMMQ